MIEVEKDQSLITKIMKNGNFHQNIHEIVEPGRGQEGEIDKISKV